MTTTCEKIRDLLVDYADGELAAADTQAVEAHLETCTDCRQMLAALTKSLSLAQNIWQQRLTDTEQPVPARPRSVWGWRTAVQAACILLLVGASFLLARRPTGPSLAPALTLAEIQRQADREDARQHQHHHALPAEERLQVHVDLPGDAEDLVFVPKRQGIDPARPHLLDVQQQIDGHHEEQEELEKEELCGT